MNHIAAAALGSEPFDLVLDNLRFVNLNTEEVYPAQIGVKAGRIAHVTPPGGSGLVGETRRDCQNAYALPGFIDSHVHIESSMLTPGNFAAAVIPRGTTTVVADPHEFCNVRGTAGMAYVRDASRSIRLRVLLAAPSCVPALVGAETNFTTFGPDEIRDMLAMPETVSLGEVMDYPGVVHQSQRMRDILAAARASGKIIQGHIIDPTDRELSAYLAAGCESDHECRTIEDAMRKLRAGMTLECRNGSTAKNLPVEAEALAKLNYPVNATLCTDDREPHDLLEIGHLDSALRSAVRHGIPAMKALQMATRNAALFLGLRDRGNLRPGSLADIVLVRDLVDFQIEAVFIGGELVAENGRMAVAIPHPDLPFEHENTVRIQAGLTPDSFRFRLPEKAALPAPGSVTLNCITFPQGDPFLTQLLPVSFPVRDGCADLSGLPDFATLAVLERHHASGNLALAPVHNTGLREGAVAGTVSHDSHNLFVFGMNPEDMLTAVKRIVHLGGGFVAVRRGEVAAEVPLPVAGLVSKRPAAEVAAEMAAMKIILGEMGLVGEAPLHMLTWFSLAVLPEVRLTDKGLFDTVRQVFLPMYI